MCNFVWQSEMKHAVNQITQYVIRALALLMVLMAECQELAATVLTDMVVPQPAESVSVPSAEKIKRLLQTGVVTAGSEISEIRMWLKEVEQYELRTKRTSGAGGLPMGI